MSRYFPNYPFSLFWCVSPVNYAYPWVVRARAYLDQRQVDKAWADFTEALRLDATTAEAYSGRGEASFHRGDFQHASEDFNEVVCLRPDDLRALVHVSSDTNPYPVVTPGGSRP
jgi:tetratricopeptide (TPR) repeat protein